ncbi:MAG TPA: hypothetical protein PLG55_06350 [Methanospirillum sp.]|jgi:hypothetical protein|uniref:DUF3467 domain-containing protein n=1 Tax=Methanospirillum sp. TaxID=45200 RepID=UPI0009CEB5B9|nr:DUF3467 domain-containing protein [Methanospirillum sp.]OQB39148.1 MAG: hypothetical protein BWY05_00096 [Euryarchaeota archaeon ADurb.Bin165]HPY60324.1 hypothetical protein [Methanospirillum sp.]
MQDNTNSDGPETNIFLTRYCNSVNIQASNNDIAFDFMELPGIPRDGKQVIEGVRVYMTHDHARLMAELILKTFEKSNDMVNSSSE